MGDGVIYDLNPPDGLPDTFEVYQYGVEAGVAYDFYRDGRVAKAIFEFDILNFAGLTINETLFSVRSWSFREGSFYDIYVYKADGVPSLNDWNATNSYYFGRYTSLGWRELINITTAMQIAVGANWGYLGIRIEGGPLESGGHIGFVASEWVPNPNVIYPDDYPHIVVTY